MPRGGKREGSGRPVGSNRYGEITTRMRIPMSKVLEIENYLEKGTFKIPLYAAKIPAGTPRDAKEHIETYVDMTSALIKNPGGTFFLRMVGDSMTGASINDGDILIVDKKLKAKNGKIVVAYLDNEATVKRLKKDGDGIFLMPANARYKPIQVQDFNNFYVAGVVTGVIKKFA